ncbi:hypothetical protein BLS_000401 [Venturia inaequalis]|uniref:Uncharacterized protein n=1 Tax=Venturia inaequalis TaxID=5025 RepID=A0A8H3YYL7_VENIN|nr:hypothetical protein BLS_000401 [Venturia inaequalis]
MRFGVEKKQEANGLSWSEETTRPRLHEEQYDDDDDLRVPCPPHTTERRLVNKIDLHVLPYLCILYLLAFLDRVNISNANIFGLSKELHLLKDNRYNICLVIFFVPYVLFEIPSNVLLKKFKPNVWLSFCMFPGCFYLIGMWYRRHEAQRRYSFFFSSTTLAGAFGALLASAIGKMDGLRGYQGWRWIFILEGTLTCLVSFAFFFLIPTFPEDAKWLTPEERTYVSARLRQDQGRSALERKITLSDVVQVFKDPKIVIGGFMYFGLIVPGIRTHPVQRVKLLTLSAYGYAYFSPGIIQSYGYSRIQTQLYSVPPWAAAFGFAMIIAYLSDKTKHRFLFTLIPIFVALAGFATLLAVHNNKQIQYAALFLCAMGAYSAMPVIVCWFNMNLGGHHRRAIGSAWQVGFGNIGGIIAVFAFLAKDSPKYVPGYMSVTDGEELDNPNSNTTTHLSTIVENESLLPATFRHNSGYTSLKRALSCEGDSDLFEGDGPPSKQHKLTTVSIPAIDPSSLDIPASLATSLPHHPAPASQSNNVTIPVATASTLTTQPAQYHGVPYDGQQLNALDAPTQPWKPQYSINLLSLQILKYKSKNSRETCELSLTRELLDMCFEQMDPKTFTTIFVKHGRLLVEIRDLEEILGNTFVKKYLVKNGIPQGALAAPGGTQSGLMDPYRVLSIAFSSGCQECKRSTDYKYIYWVFCRCICELCMKEHMLSQDGVLEMLRQAKFKHPERIGMLLLCIVYKANGSAKPFYNRIYYDAIVRALITNYKAFEATENIPRTISFHTWCTRQQHRINNRLLAARLMRRWQNNVAAEEVRRHIEENDDTRLERNLQIKAMVADMEPPIPADVLEDCPAYKNQSTFAGLLTELAWTILEPKIKAYARSRRVESIKKQL